MQRSILLFGAAAAGIALVAISIVYFAEPASSLPGFFPGHDPEITRHHVKHAVAVLLLALACFVYVWFGSGKKQSAN